jgi:hypothetical protein
VSKRCRRMASAPGKRQAALIGLAAQQNHQRTLSVLLAQQNTKLRSVILRLWLNGQAAKPHSLCLPAWLNASRAHRATHVAKHLATLGLLSRVAKRQATLAVLARVAKHQATLIKRATQGGYGGKPPCVAIIGVPTGARNAGNGALTGDQSTDMNGTTKRPPMCKDQIKT